MYEYDVLNICKYRLFGRRRRQYTASVGEGGGGALQAIVVDPLLPADTYHISLVE